MLFRTWDALNSNSYNIPFVATWQRERMAVKIREYFGVDVDVEKE